MSCKALAVHNGVYTDGVRVGPRGSAYNHKLAAEIFSDKFVRFLHAHDVVVHRLHGNGGVVDGIRAFAVNDVKGKFLVQRLGARHRRLVESHFFGKLNRRLLPLVVVFYGQSEAHLNLSVVHCVAVGAQLFEVESGVEFFVGGIVKSAAHFASSLSAVLFLRKISMKGLK